MPHIAVHLYPGRDKDTKQAIADKVADFATESLGFPADVVSVSIVETPGEEFAEKVSARYDADELYVSSDVINYNK